MKQKFAVFDIDGTVFRSTLYYEMVLEMARREKLHPNLNERTLELYNAWKNPQERRELRGILSRHNTAHI